MDKHQGIYLKAIRCFKYMTKTTDRVFFLSSHKQFFGNYSNIFSTVYLWNVPFLKSPAPWNSALVEAHPRKVPFFDNLGKLSSPSGDRERPETGWERKVRFDR